MRRKVKIKTSIEPDYRYGSIVVSKLINHIMLSGKKNIARKIVYSALDLAGKTAKKEPMTVLDEAIKNISPALEVRSRRVGGANYQVPREVRPERRLTLAMRWLIQAAESKKGKPMSEKLAEELILASKNEGAAVKKKEDTHKMAEANRAFAHFAW
ncbi:MAG: 30S ribosomal protein S7 [Candidatus Niyogibacteria bacterium]|nr:MAG: 30S ribosomal protein S7 [Candidatus Niyogibacteria bacterium]